MAKGRRTDSKIHSGSNRYSTPAAPAARASPEPRRVGGRSAEPRPGPAPPAPRRREAEPGGRSRPGRFLVSGAGGDRSPPRRCGGPAAAMASLFKKKTVDGEWAPGAAPDLARPRARGCSGPGLLPAGAPGQREPGGGRSLGPRVPAERERSGCGAGGPGPPAVTHPLCSGRAPGPALARRGEAFPAHRQGGTGPGRPGPWVREEEEQHGSVAARDAEQAHRELLGPGGAGTRSVPPCGSHVRAAGAAAAPPGLRAAVQTTWSWLFVASPVPKRLNFIWNSDPQSKAPKDASAASRPLGRAHSPHCRAPGLASPGFGSPACWVPRVTSGGSAFEKGSQEMTLHINQLCVPGGEHAQVPPGSSRLRCGT